MKRNMLGFYLLMSCLFLILGNCSSVRHGNVVPTQGHDEGIRQNQKQIDSVTEVKVQKNYGKLPLYFIQNDGQMDEKVQFYEKGSGHATFFTKRDVSLSLVGGQQSSVRKGGSAGLHPKQDTGWHGQTGLSVSLANPQSSNQKPEVSTCNSPLIPPQLIKLIPLSANNNPEIIAEGLQEGKVNYFIGNDPKKWKSNIPTYKTVVYKGIYNNIDMKFYGNNRQMEYDIVVKPGASPSRVQFSYHGIEGLQVTEDGDLEISLKDDKIIQKRPYVYQEIDGKRVERDGKFRVLSSELGIPPQNPKSKSKVRNRKFIYGFQVASYDKRYPLVIDPVLEYSTYLGGSGNDHGIHMAIDGLGNAYVTGYTQSTDFPTASAYRGSNAGGYDAFVTKISASGDALIYSTYLGGSSYDYGRGIAVDGSGNAYVSGETNSSNFPTASAYQATNAGGFDAFVTKISASGDILIYSTYLGGSSQDIHYGGVAVDGLGNAYVTGYTQSTDFPTASAYQGSNVGGYDTFVTKISVSGVPWFIPRIWAEVLMM
ncbi:MAG: hypothetical protein DYG83_18165 [Candidatus Brocadia sp. AMX2]|uniref:Protein with FOG domain and PKD repeat n=1 Tax=Candidatus Brocadia sinica JPN1 TaxID=1197129 RepID=A0ABQ0K224_9BACT|nr:MULTISPECIES: SBBP repeat-containing protein [Brocadia]MBC6934146.1 hypothetical protein [Candidatus Brocadia sp.]MBL1170735.1 hypothetical protein [Candidatus Brocadia sp. AMX1]NOG42884.1 hypothetical protein [Planctomycetota bacterium]GIK12116.1 MAG: hypothetical protein BroJett002_08230 [Candidatus Brocadia sinica]KAA0241182.1 MAG: hypothetical protein EDM70_18590 [Candidatus Brocadia sp. AMX2]